MKSINWKANAELLGIAALFGLLIFVGLALPFYVVGILLTAAIFVLLGSSGLAFRRLFLIAVFFSWGQS